MDVNVNKQRTICKTRIYALQRAIARQFGSEDEDFNTYDHIGTAKLPDNYKGYDTEALQKLKESAINIAHNIVHNNIQYVNVIKDMQSGKTLLILFISLEICKMEEQQSWVTNTPIRFAHSSHMFVVMGTTSTTLIEQTKERMPSLAEYGTSAGIDVLGVNQLKKHQKTLAQMNGGILFHIDESHLGARKGQTIYNILKDILFTKDAVTNGRHVIIEYSATPLLDAICNRSKMDPTRFLECYVQSGSTYHGLKQIVDKGLFIDTIEEKQDIMYDDTAMHAYLQRLYASIHSSTAATVTASTSTSTSTAAIGKMYNLIRVPVNYKVKKEDQEVSVRPMDILCHKLLHEQTIIDCDVICVHSEQDECIKQRQQQQQARETTMTTTTVTKTHFDYSANEVKAMLASSDPPKKETFILIKNMFRSGDTLGLHHIRSARERKTAGEHGTLQGILGRMTGYDNRGNTNILLFGNLSIVQEYLWKIKTEHMECKIKAKDERNQSGDDDVDDDTEKTTMKRRNGVKRKKHISDPEFVDESEETRARRLDCLSEMARNDAHNRQIQENVKRRKFAANLDNDMDLLKQQVQRNAAKKSTKDIVQFFFKQADHSYWCSVLERQPYTTPLKCPTTGFYQISRNKESPRVYSLLEILKTPSNGMHASTNLKHKDILFQPFVFNNEQWWMGSFHGNLCPDKHNIIKNDPKGPTALKMPYDQQKMMVETSCT